MENEWTCTSTVQHPRHAAEEINTNFQVLGQFPQSTRKHTLVQNSKEQQVWSAQNIYEPSWMCLTRGYRSNISWMMIFRERAHLQETKLLAIFSVSLMETVTVLLAAQEQCAMKHLDGSRNGGCVGTVPKSSKIHQTTPKIGLSLLIQQETNWWWSIHLRYHHFNKPPACANVHIKRLLCCLLQPSENSNSMLSWLCSPKT